DYLSVFGPEQGNVRGAPPCNRCTGRYGRGAARTVRGPDAQASGAGSECGAGGWVGRTKGSAPPGDTGRSDRRRGPGMGSSTGPQAAVNRKTSEGVGSLPP